MKTFNFVCGGAEAPEKFDDGEIVPMNVEGAEKNVQRNIADISKTMRGQIKDIHLDLFEVAAYVYCADQRTKRGPEELGNMGSQWRRRMNFIIPVRCLDVWSTEDVTSSLEETLGFLSEHIFSFVFVNATAPAQETAPHFSFTDENLSPDEIALFSGGVDSLAGAVVDVVGNGKKMALVGHHSSSKVFKHQKQLVKEFQQRGIGSRAFFIPVEVTNSNVKAKEYTQRSRSFLFASLAAVVASIYGKNRFTFYENGVISLNLPLSKDAMGARSTRTTHPKVIRGFEQIFSAVFDEKITIDTPLQWLTKTEVAQKLKEFGFENLLGLSSSCTRPYGWTKEKHHCGLCSQCIDRRFAVLAAGLAESDPASGYKVDLLLGDRSQDKEIAMAADYVRLAQKVRATPKERFASTFPEIFSAADHFPGLSSSEAIEKMYELFKRHADAVFSVIRHGLQEHGTEILDENLPSGSLLAMCFNRGVIKTNEPQDVQAQLNDFIDRLSPAKCEFFYDANGQVIYFKGGVELKGANFSLFEALLDKFRTARANGHDVEYFLSRDLADHLKIDDATLRRRVTRFHEGVSYPLKVSLGIVDDLIENKHGVGYRLNGVLKEVFSKADLED